MKNSNVFHLYSPGCLASDWDINKLSLSRKYMAITSAYALDSARLSFHNCNCSNLNCKFTLIQNFIIVASNFINDVWVPPTSYSNKKLVTVWEFFNPVKLFQVHPKFTSDTFC